MSEIGHGASRRCDREQLVLSEHSLDHGDTADEKDHDQGQVGSGETGQVAEEHGDSSRSGKLLPAFRGDGKGNADPESKSGEDRRDFGYDGTRNNTRPGGGRAAMLASVRRVCRVEGEGSHVGSDPTKSAVQDEPSNG